MLCGKYGLQSYIFMVSPAKNGYDLRNYMSIDIDGLKARKSAWPCWTHRRIVLENDLSINLSQCNTRLIPSPNGIYQLDRVMDPRRRTHSSRSASSGIEIIQCVESSASLWQSRMKYLHIRRYQQRSWEFNIPFDRCGQGEEGGQEPKRRPKVPFGRKSYVEIDWDGSEGRPNIGLGDMGQKGRKNWPPFFSS